MRIDPATPDDVADLAALLVDAVEGGASVGFLAGVTQDQANAFWRGALAHPTWVARVGQRPWASACCAAAARHGDGQRRGGLLRAARLAAAGRAAGPRGAPRGGPRADDVPLEAAQPLNDLGRPPSAARPRTERGL
jgi:hypothetical protein